MTNTLISCCVIPYSECFLFWSFPKFCIDHLVSALCNKLFRHSRVQPSRLIVICNAVILGHVFPAWCPKWDWLFKKIVGNRPQLPLWQLCVHVNILPYIHRDRHSLYFLFCCFHPGLIRTLPPTPRPKTLLSNPWRFPWPTQSCCSEQSCVLAGPYTKDTLLIRESPFTRSHSLLIVSHSHKIVYIVPWQLVA